MKEGFIFYRSFVEAAQTLNDRDRLRLYDSIAHYALDGVLPEISGAALGMFYLIKPQIDANNKRFENGKRGGRPRKNEPDDEQSEDDMRAYGEPIKNRSITDGFQSEKPNHNQTITKPKAKEKEKVKVKEKDNVKEKDKGKGSSKDWVDERIRPEYLKNLNAMRVRIAGVNEGRKS